MTSIWTPSRELWTPRKPSLLRKVTDWVRMATAGQTLLNSSGQTAMNSSGQELVYDTGGCGCCGGTCVLTFSISNFTFGTLYGTTKFVEPSGGYSTTINSSIEQPYTNPARVLFPCVAGSGYNFSQEGELSFSSTPFPVFTFSRNTLVWSIPVSGTSPNYYATAGNYAVSGGYGIQLALSYPSASPINGGVGSSISVSGGPITQMRSYASPGYLTVPTSTTSPWGGTLTLNSPQTCSGISGNFGPYVVDSSMSSWDGYEITECNFYSFGATASHANVSGAAAWMLQFQLNYSGSTYYAGYYSLSSTAVGTYYAADPLTLPQTLTVS